MKTRAILSALCLAVLALGAAPAAAEAIRFSQRPDMVNGTDYVSMHRSNGPVVADDFIIDKPQIVGFRWWGSYFHDDPNLLPGVSRNVTFEVSHHPDCPAGAPISARCPGDPRSTTGGPTPYPYSTPGQPYQFQIPVVATETFFGTTAAGERVYEYLGYLNTPWNAFVREIAWVDIAWNAGQFDTDPFADIWGWHESDEHFGDWAVQTDRLAPPPGANPHLGPWNVLAGRDMAFQVIYAPEPTTLALLGLALIGLQATRRRTLM